MEWNFFCVLLMGELMLKHVLPQWFAVAWACVGLC